MSTTAPVRSRRDTVKMIMRSNLRCVSPFLAALVVGCGTTASGESPAFREVPEWKLSATPAVSIGAEDRGPDYQFHVVTGAAVLPDGRIVVADAGSGSLAVYDRTGRFLSRIGRKGEGPGEFQTPGWIGAAGDSLVAWDQNLRRLSVFGPDGRLVRTAGFSGVDGTFPRVLGRLADGTFAVDPGPDTFAMMGAQPGVHRDSVTLARFTADGAALGQLGRIAGDETFLYERPTGVGWQDVPFGRRSFAVASAHGLYVADGGTGEVSVYAADGTRTRVIRSPHARWRVTPEDVARYKEERVALIADATRRREVEQALSRVPFPDAAPAVAGLAVDADGNAWIQAEPRPGEEFTRWAVVSPDGALDAHVSVPSGLRVLEVGRDHLLGLWRDEIGVESVRVYQLQRGGV